ncbi:glycosyltransferase family 4 protein [Salinibacillus aidingensis]|uniref:Glycosyltransferase family 4 protein n=1 Tax=Salinibacillus aidingensis TaxID=237684 RepID=A0ABN1AYI8_9BACI
MSKENLKKKKKLIFIGPLPPPIHGESIALESLYKSNELHDLFNVRKIDTSKHTTDNAGVFTLSKTIMDMANIFRAFMSSLLYRNSIIYLSISQTKLGLFRDCIIIFLCKLFGNCKVITHLHGNNLANVIDETNGFLNKFISYTLKKVDIGIVLGKKLSKNYKGLVQKVKVVSNGIPFNFIKTDEIHSKPNKDFFSILYLSNLMEEKGYIDLIKATTELINEGYNLQLNLAGSIFNKEDFNEVLQYIENKKVDKYITYCGIKKGDEKKDLFLGADVMVLPTKYKVEGQPMSIIEGMAAGLPIISTNKGIIAELIAGCGYIIQPSVKDLKEAIKKLYNDKNEQLKLGKSSRDIYEHYYTEEKYIDSLIKTFQQI